MEKKGAWDARAAATLLALHDQQAIVHNLAGRRLAAKVQKLEFPGIWVLCCDFLWGEGRFMDQKKKKTWGLLVACDLYWQAQVNATLVNPRWNPNARLNSLLCLSLMHS